ncbi:hypothetical protein FB451DRAFT_1178289 [Mycena latifolia]|nr:hypothetical protein FB451DRAFT_1178289 [Mycena latifolia]
MAWAAPSLQYHIPIVPPFKGTIFKYSDQLFRLSLDDSELDSYPWSPEEPWPVFFENRLCPMIYFLHAGITHDFTLVGRKGIYGPEEQVELRYWLEQIMLHCVSCLPHVRPATPAPAEPFRHGVSIFGGLGTPISYCLRNPGEATKMFEILYRLSMSLGFPESTDVDLPLNRFTLLPLICEARRTRAALKTPDEFHPYNEYGGLDDPTYLHPESGNTLEVEVVRRFATGDQSTRNSACWIFTNHFGKEEGALIPAPTVVAARCSTRRFLYGNAFPSTALYEGLVSLVSKVIGVREWEPWPRIYPLEGGTRKGWLDWGARIAERARRMRLEGPPISGSIRSRGRLWTVLMEAPNYMGAPNLQAVRFPSVFTLADFPLDPFLSGMKRRTIEIARAFRCGSSANVTDSVKSAPPIATLASGSASRQLRQKVAPPVRADPSASAPPKSKVKKKKKTDDSKVPAVAGPSKSSKGAFDGVVLAKSTRGAAAPSGSSSSRQPPAPTPRKQVKLAPEKTFLGKAIPEDLPENFRVKGANDRAFNFDVHPLPVEAHYFPVTDDSFTLYRAFRFLPRDAPRFCDIPSMMASDWKSTKDGRVILDSVGELVPTNCLEVAREGIHQLDVTIRVFPPLCDYVPETSAPLDVTEPITDLHLFPPVVQKKEPILADIFSLPCSEVTAAIARNRELEEQAMREYNDAYAAAVESFQTEMESWEARVEERRAKFVEEEQFRVRQVQDYAANRLSMIHLAQCSVNLYGELAVFLSDNPVAATPSAPGPSNPSGAVRSSPAPSVHSHTFGSVASANEDDEDDEDEEVPLSLIAQGKRRAVLEPPVPNVSGMIPTPSCFVHKNEAMVDTRVYDWEYHTHEPLGCEAPFIKFLCTYDGRKGSGTQRVNIGGHPTSGDPACPGVIATFEWIRLQASDAPPLMHLTHGPGCRPCSTAYSPCVRIQYGLDMHLRCILCNENRGKCNIDDNFDFTETDKEIAIHNRRFFELYTRNSMRMFSELFNEDFSEILLGIALSLRHDPSRFSEDEQVVHPPSNSAVGAPLGHGPPPAPATASEFTNSTAAAFAAVFKNAEKMALKAASANSPEARSYASLNATAQGLERLLGLVKEQLGLHALGRIADERRKELAEELGGSRDELNTFDGEEGGRSGEPRMGLGESLGADGASGGSGGDDPMDGSGASAVGAKGAPHAAGGVKGAEGGGSGARDTRAAGGSDVEKGAGWEILPAAKGASGSGVAGGATSGGSSGASAHIAPSLVRTAFPFFLSPRFPFHLLPSSLSLFCLLVSIWNRFIRPPVSALRSPHLPRKRIPRRAPHQTAATAHEYAGITSVHLGHAGGPFIHAAAAASSVAPILFFCSFLTGGTGSGLVSSSSLGPALRPPTPVPLPSSSGAPASTVAPDGPPDPETPKAPSALFDDDVPVDGGADTPSSAITGRFFERQSSGISACLTAESGWSSSIFPERGTRRRAVFLVQKAFSGSPGL